MTKKNIENIQEEKIRTIPERQIIIENYMPYAMSVITDRALPAIDGFKPSHRKLLYTMFRMGLLTGNRQKSANIAGAGMKYSPHGDAGIYETMVRLTQNNEALLMPFVDGKGNFGKIYSKDTAYAAPRYTEAKLMPICNEIFKDLEKNAVDMVDNYDGTEKEPVLLPTSFPNILVSANMGIAVGMACNFPGFNFTEVCKATVEYIKHPENDIRELMPAPDFSTGGEILLNQNEMDEIYKTGKGSFKIRSIYTVDEKQRLILVREIPYTSSVEAIIEKIAGLMKSGKVSQISDVRDESDLNGLCIAIDYKRGCNPEDLMQQLMENTPLVDNFSCNFNLLIDGIPKTLGIKEILDEWISFRVNAKKRALTFENEQLNKHLVLLLGLESILKDIENAVKIVKEASSENLALQGLMKKFSLDKEQAEFVANLKLRNFNKDYILRQTKEISALKKKIAEILKILSSENGIKNAICKELTALLEKYPCKRHSSLVEFEAPKNEKVPFFIEISPDGYIKRSKAGLLVDCDTEILVFSNSCDVYKAKAGDVDKEKPIYAASLAELDSGESMTGFLLLESDKYIAILYASGNVSLYKMSDFETKQNRKKLKESISSLSHVIGIISVSLEDYLTIKTSKERYVTIAVSSLPLQKRGGYGRLVIKAKRGETLLTLRLAKEEEISQMLKQEQLSMDFNNSQM